jgi:hypothetical protein
MKAEGADDPGLPPLVFSRTNPNGVPAVFAKQLLMTPGKPFFK